MGLGRTLRSNGVGGRVARAGVLAAALSIGTVGLASCGGPSSSATASQDLSAGIAAQKAGDFGTASTDYEKVLKIEPKNVYALYDLGDVEQFQHQDAAAQTHYLMALAVSPKFENALYNLAILDAKADPRQAKVLYLQVIALTPHDAPAHLNLGKVLLALGEAKAGDAQINLAIKLDPSLKHDAPAGS